ncbi:hypothetical protein ACFSTC_51045 [Nonomuraea ferruginea]
MKISLGVRRRWPVAALAALAMATTAVHVPLAAAEKVQKELGRAGHPRRRRAGRARDHPHHR